MVNISSGASRMALGGLAAYGSAKAGLNQLTRITAAEFAPKVRVNCISAGLVDTPGSGSVNKGKIAQQVAARIPLQRIGSVDDIAGCALYLASPAACWVTGKIIEVDGGADVSPISIPLPPL